MPRIFCHQQVRGRQQESFQKSRPKVRSALRRQETSDNTNICASLHSRNGGYTRNVFLCCSEGETKAAEGTFCSKRQSRNYGGSSDCSLGFIQLPLLLCKMGVSLYSCSLWGSCVSLTCCHSERTGLTRAKPRVGKLRGRSECAAQVSSSKSLVASPSLFSLGGQGRELHALLTLLQGRQMLGTAAD